MLKKPAAVYIAIFFFAAICLYGIANIHLIKEPLEQLAEDKNTDAFIADVQKAYVSDELFSKDFLISVNGLYARLTNRCVYNGVTLLKNGMLLIEQPHYRDMKYEADQLCALKEYLEIEKNIPFLYVQCGTNIDLEQTVLRVDSSFNDYEKCDQLLERLRLQGVNTIDLRQKLNGTIEDTEKYYFRTDQHWNYAGALVGLQMITQEMDKLFPEYEFDLSHTEFENWEKHTLKNFLLGNVGRRVGPWYAGVEDFFYYTPKFDTDMSCVIYNGSAALLNKGDFETVNIQKKKIAQRDYLRSEPYFAYVGANYPVVKYRNMNAPNDLKILMIRDSFSIPLQVYMASLFTEVDAVDPRHYKGVTLTDCLQADSYDIVLMVLAPFTIFKSDFFSFVDVSNTAYNVTDTVRIDSIVVNEDKKAGNSKALPVELKPGNICTVKIDRAELLSGNTRGFMLNLQDVSANKVLQSMVFDLEYGNRTDGFTWVFDIPQTDHDLKLVLYSGTNSKAADAAVDFQGIEIVQQNKGTE